MIARVVRKLLYSRLRSLLMNTNVLSEEPARIETANVLNLGNGVPHVRKSNAI